MEAIQTQVRRLKDRFGVTDEGETVHVLISLLDGRLSQSDTDEDAFFLRPAVVTLACALSRVQSRHAFRLESILVSYQNFLPEVFDECADDIAEELCRSIRHACDSVWQFRLVYSLGLLLTNTMLSHGISVLMNCAIVSNMEVRRQAYTMLSNMVLLDRYSASKIRVVWWNHTVCTIKQLSLDAEPLINALFETHYEVPMTAHEVIRIRPHLTSTNQARLNFLYDEAGVWRHAANFIAPVAHWRIRALTDARFLFAPVKDKIEVSDAERCK